MSLTAHSYPAFFGTYSLSPQSLEVPILGSLHVPFKYFLEKGRMNIGSVFGLMEKGGAHGCLQKVSGFLLNSETQTEFITFTINFLLIMSI